MYTLALYKYERTYVVHVQYYIIHITFSVCVLIHVVKGVYMYTVYFNVYWKILDRALYTLCVTPARHDECVIVQYHKPIDCLTTA